MYIVHVYCHVKPESIDDFKQITIENARNSVQEPGVARFDVMQHSDDPTRFVLVEVYHTSDDPSLHRETAHYAAWVAAAQDMLAEPRSKAIFNSVFPDESGWE